ncbi:MAG TPA: HNH endonuclease signature motif containing protein [Paenirhodobacter sp.]
MARLRQMPSLLGSAPMRLGAAPRNEAERSAQRMVYAPWRAWYKTVRWRRTRWSVLLAASFTCARCGRLEGDTSQLVADHIHPHRGSDVLFWDQGNLQCLCKACHDGDKQREERRAPPPVW